MNWVKSNFGMVIGGGIALVLMGVAGWFLYTQIKAEESSQANLNQEFTDLRKLLNRDPHPGDPDRKVDNIGAIQSEQKKLDKDLITPLRSLFKPFVVSEGLDTFKFKSLLEDRVAAMQRAAEKSGTSLPTEGDTKYSFSFSDVRPKVDFALQTLSPMAFQLLQIEALSQVLFDAKVHSINAIKRPEISEAEEETEETASDDFDDYEDENANSNPYAGYEMMYGSMYGMSSANYNFSGSWFGGMPEDYIQDEEITITTNNVTGAIISPFQLSFQCFSSELSDVMAGLNDSEYFFRIKWMAVESSSSDNMISPSSPSSTMPESRYPGRNSLGMNSRYGASGRYGTEGYMMSPMSQGMIGMPNESMEGLEEKPLTVNMFVEVISLPPPMEKLEEDSAGNDIGQRAY